MGQELHGTWPAFRSAFEECASLFDAALVKPALWGAFAKLNPRTQWRNPVMFIVYIGSILTSLLSLGIPRRVRQTTTPTIALEGATA